VNAHTIRPQLHHIILNGLLGRQQHIADLGAVVTAFIERHFIGFGAHGEAGLLIHKRSPFNHRYAQLSQKMSFLGWKSSHVRPWCIQLNVLYPAKETHHAGRSPQTYR
jgi:hypothetical protein